MKCVVLLSGGLDSAVLLAALLGQGDECYAVTFDYGQQNRIREMLAARTIATHYGIAHRRICLPSNIFGASALLDDSAIPHGHAEEPDATVVTGRNMVFLACAAAVAGMVGATSVMFGANYDDRAGYTDCRPKFIDHIDEAAYWSHGVRVAAPLLFSKKPNVIALGRELDAPLHLTWSCYTAGPEQCGRCGACELRQEAMA